MIRSSHRRRPIAAASAVLVASLLAACGQAPMGSAEEGAPPPADAPAATPPGPDYGGAFDLVGTEPFWGVKIRADGVTLSRPGEPDVSMANDGARLLGDVGVWGTGHMVVKLTPEDCSDGMSDRRYGYAAEVTVNGQVLKGCGARPADLAAQPRP